MGVGDGVVQVEVSQFFAGHDAGADFGDGYTGGLGDERHGAGGAGVDFEDVDEVVLDGVLDVHQADDVECFGHGFGFGAQFGDRGGGEGVGRD